MKSRGSAIILALICLVSWAAAHGESYKRAGPSDHSYQRIVHGQYQEARAANNHHGLSYASRTLLQSAPTVPSAPSSTPTSTPRAPHTDLPPVPYQKGNTVDPNLKWYLIGGICGGGALVILIVIIVCCCVCSHRRNKAPQMSKPPVKKVPKAGEPMSPTLAAAYAAATGIPTSPMRNGKATTTTSPSTASTSTTAPAASSSAVIASEASSGQNTANASSSTAAVEAPLILPISLQNTTPSAANTLRALNTGRGKRVHAATPFQPVHVPDSSDDSTTTSEGTDESSDEESSEEDDSETDSAPTSLPPPPVALESESSEEESSSSNRSDEASVALSARSPAASPRNNHFIGDELQEDQMEHVDEEGFDDW